MLEQHGGAHRSLSTTKEHKQMIRSALSKVVWMARATTVVVGLAIMLGLIFGVATSAFGANGGNFILGSLNNTATAITKLTGTVGGGPALQVSNPSTATGSTALDLQVATGKAPMKVNRTTKVTSLNADLLDGKDSSTIGRELFAAVNQDGTVARSRGNPTVTTFEGQGLYRVKFGSDISKCVYSATLVTAAPDSRVEVEPVDSTTVRVITGVSSSVVNLPFHLIVVC
jgi:hypothetical protein